MIFRSWHWKMSLWLNLLWPWRLKLSLQPLKFAARFVSNISFNSEREYQTSGYLKFSTFNPNIQGSIKTVERKNHASLKGRFQLSKLWKQIFLNVSIYVWKKLRWSRSFMLLNESKYEEIVAWNRFLRSYIKIIKLSTIFHSLSLCSSLYTSTWKRSRRS